MIAINPMLIALAAVYIAFTALVGVKWLRVAQREHYIPGWTTRIAAMWNRTRPFALVPLYLAPAAGIAFVWLALSANSWIAMIGADLGFLLTAWWPLGLSFRGKSSALQWTTRARRLAAVWLVLWFAVSVAGAILLTESGQILAAVLEIFPEPVVGIVVWLILADLFVVTPAVLAPLVMDLALVVMKPIEKALSRKWLLAAQKKLRQVRPTVVAITGSYGKTSTKGYVAHLLGANFSVVPSPASFNNLMGLARAVNDKLTPGTEVFVAEMGVYGEGEIRELTRSFPPDIAAITVIGESHLERMRDRGAILRAKSEIVDNARTVVLPIDDPRLAALADRCASEGKRVVRVSAEGSPADVSVDPGRSVVTVGKDSAPVEIPGVGHAVNIAVAVGIGVASGLDLAVMAPRLGNLPTAAHRAEPQMAPSGTIIIDDSYNANPVGAARAIKGGAEMAAARGGEFLVVTPGMIELGPVQRERNTALAAQVAEAGGKLYAVGYTNRKALVAGHPSARVFADRATAMTAALTTAGATGVILVENDLPDHYA